MTTFASNKLRTLAPNLQILSLSKTTLAVGCLAFLSNLHLVELDLSHTNVTNKDLKLMLKKPNNNAGKTMRSLNTEGTIISLATHSMVLKYFPNLEELIMDHSTLNVLLLISPPTVCKLNNVVIGFDDIFATANNLYLSFEQLTFVKKVRLNLSRIIYNDNVAFKQQIEHLTFHEVCLENVEFMMSIITLSSNSLKWLKFKLWFKHYHDDVILNWFDEHFQNRDPAHFPSLKYLSIDESYEIIPSNIIVNFFTGAQNLVRLKLQRCVNFTDTMVFEIFANGNLKRLESLELNRCLSINTDGILFLMDKRSLNKLLIEYHPRNILSNPNRIADTLKKIDNEWTVIDSSQFVLWIEKI